MYKIFFVVFALLCASCNIIIDTRIDDYLSSHIVKAPIYYPDDYSSDYLWDIPFYIMRKVEYRSDKGDVWSTAKTTLERGYGDCEDYAILFMDMAYAYCGVVYDLVAIDDTNTGRAIVDGGKINHAIVQNRETGEYIDPQLGCAVFPAKVGYKYQLELFFIK